ncbi:peptidase domain-containing ABC transporter [Elioraea sp.]|uniref:peptidase domain-containing ABC transporter n=1 Tax=Elioraea sp. TaxID=2185103 RepID=UPI0025C1A54A|nr:ATP-binding cassette domain-containing protein [Elioraea sp.]
MNAMPPPSWLGTSPWAGLEETLVPVPVPATLVEPGPIVTGLGLYLAALGWQGGPAQLVGAMPHACGHFDIAALRVTLVNLGYPTVSIHAAHGALRPEHLPALVIEAGDRVAVLVGSATGGILRVTAGGVHERIDSLDIDCPVLCLAPKPVQASSRDAWLRGVLLGFAPLARPMLGASFLLAVLALAVPLFTMAVFDVLIGAGDAGPLPLLLIGLCLALLFEGLFRAARLDTLARIGERLDSVVAHSVLDRLLGLPLAMTERVGIAAQVNRVRDFGTVREFFSGSLAIAALDAPFALMLVGVLAAVGGPVAIAPAVAVLLFALLFIAVGGPMRRAVSSAAVTAQQRDQLALETLGAMRLIRASGASPVWRARHAAAAAEAAAAAARVGALGGIVTALGQAIVGVTALAAVAFGVHAVLGGTITAGGLIAAMMVIWRVLGPIQMAFTILSRWEQVRTSMRQVDQMMALAPESEHRSPVRPVGSIRGDIGIARLSLRYQPQAEPALLGVNAEIRAGQVIALVGPSGAGKTSLLLSVLGIHRASAGSVRIDGLDIRRFDPVELRRAIAYAPAVPQIIYGTVTQNLLLAAPGASEAEIRAAASITGLDRLVASLPDGFDTRLGDNGAGMVAASLVTRISLTRILLRRSRIVLMDEPANGLDDDGSAAVGKVIASLRGEATILIVTHRPSHIALADRILRFTEGQVEEQRRSAPPAAGPTAVKLLAQGRST